MSAFKERASIEGPTTPARPCCGVYVQQVNRIARLGEQIQAWVLDNRPSSIRDLRLALKRKQRMENWLAAHSHLPSLSDAEVAPVTVDQSPTD